MMSCTVRVLVFLAIQVLAFQGIAEATNAVNPPKRPKPEKGSAWYVMVLWEPGTPIPGSTEHIKKVKEPDLEKLKGKLLQSKDNTRFIELPVTAAPELRKHEAVATLQRVWAGEPLGELREDPYPSSSNSGLQTESDLELDWGPKDYTYDKSGNITGIGADNYSYDTAGRLIQATVGGKTETFKYDAFGNLVEKAIAGANPEVIPVDGSSNRLIGESYDAAGNMMAPKGRSSDHETMYEYDSFSMLVKTRPSRNLLYDANDELVGVITDSSHWRLMIRDFEGRLLREYTAHTEMGDVWFWQRDYVYGKGALVGGETVEWSFVHEPGEETVMGGKRHYHLDHLGSVRMVTDAVGRSVSEHDYYAFGVTPTKAFQEELLANPSIDNMRFAGHQRDFLGWNNIENRDYLDYMHARHYDPNLGRFLSVDPGDDVDPSEPQSWNKYSYVRNDPVNSTDPTGMSREENTGYPYHWNAMSLFWYGVSVSHQLDKWQRRMDERRQASILSQTNFFNSITGEPQYASFELCEAAHACIDIENLLPFVGGVAKVTRARRLWTITRAGSDRVVRHSLFGRISRHKSTGLWWSRDKAGHGGSVWKVFEETPQGLRHVADADEYGNFIVGKHKGPTGKEIPWSELGR